MEEVHTVSDNVHFLVRTDLYYFSVGVAFSTDGDLKAKHEFHFNATSVPQAHFGER